MSDRYVSHKPAWRAQAVHDRINPRRHALVCIAVKGNGTECGRLLLPGRTGPEDHWELVYDK